VLLPNSLHVEVKCQGRVQIEAHAFFMNNVLIKKKEGRLQRDISFWKVCYFKNLKWPR
jgi:hypothetical protein